MKCYKLYIQDKPYPDVLLGSYKDEDGVFAAVNRWLNRNNYHAHYFRRWEKDGKNYIDFGDWHRFFYFTINEDGGLLNESK